ncbi:MAG TPA: glycosyltransferase family 87 protein [Candidatus Binatia bacterium]|nr:glycosyltransferase family 87 protein [Candidatus Binatia bacterium]
MLENTACARPVPNASCRWSRVGTLAALALVLGALVFGGASFHARATGRGTDYNVFYLGGRLVAERPLALYEVPASRGANYTYLYPPVVAVLMWPLSLVPIRASALAWFLINVACTAHSALVLTRSLAPPGLAGVFLASTLVIGLPYTVENIQLGQMHAVILYLLVLSFAGLRGHRALVGGAWMALATAIKLLPGIFGPYLLVRRQWASLGAFALVLALVTAAVPALALGPDIAAALLGRYYRIQVEPYVSGEATQHRVYARTALRKTPHDQDLGALLMRHFTAEHAVPGFGHFSLARVELDALRRAMFAIFALVLAISAVAAWPRSGDAAAEPGLSDLLFAVFVVLSLLMSPRNRVAYWTVLTIPWAVLLARVVDGRRPAGVRRLAGATLGASAALCALVAVPAGRALTLGAWAQVVLWVGLLALCRAERRAFLARP